MSSMESFYAGRQGASFVIVKRFDAIALDHSDPSIKYYRKKEYAIETKADPDDEPIYILDSNNNFIEKTAGNYLTYSWEWTLLNGDSVNVQGGGTKETEVSEQEDMVSCFSQGGSTTNIVNYGEYVIIDTLAGLGEYSNPDNGKVYRRGLNYTGELGGAEYIGQIVGPKGDVPELDIDHYKDIEANPHTYSEAEEDLVPGYYVDELEQKHYNDDIKYKYVTVRDSNGNITGCEIGFQIPTLVEDFEASSINPYDPTYRRGTPASGYYYENLISEDPTQFVDGKWQHPFYQKWQVKVPTGIHGVNSTNLEVIPTKTMPNGYKGESFLGTSVYTDAGCTTPYIVSGQPVVLGQEWSIPQGEDYTATALSVKIRYNNTDCYVKKEDCYKYILRYRETNFDNYEEGEVIYYTIGDYSNIERVDLTPDGYLNIYYSSNSQPQVIDEKIRWIYKNPSDPTQKGINIADNGTVLVYYNTFDQFGQREFDKIDDKLVWLTRFDLTQQGQLDVEYNNNKLSPIHKTLQWIDLVTIDEDGTIKLYYNSNHVTPVTTYSKFIKSINNVWIQTTAEGSSVEGSGNQKLYITYNTDEAGAAPTPIGNPFNYIIESVISRRTAEYDSVPNAHLLVYYSDPALRQAMSDKWVTYPSEKYSGTIWTEWVDLGPVEGPPGGVHFLVQVDDTDINTKLKDSQGHWIPPEQIVDEYHGGVIRDDAAGWNVIYTHDGVDEILFYDYEENVWQSMGTISSSLADPTRIIMKAYPDPNKDHLPPDSVYNKLNTNGFWLASEKVIYAN